MKELSFKFNQGSGDVNITITSELDESIVKELVYQIAAQVENELDVLIEMLNKKQHVIDLKVSLGKIFKNEYLDSLSVDELEKLSNQFLNNNSTIEKEESKNVLIYANKQDKTCKVMDVDLDNLTQEGSIKGVRLSDKDVMPFLGFNVLANTENFLGVYVNSNDNIEQMKENLTFNL